MMRLADWLTEQRMPHRGWYLECQSAMPSISAFVFGERYWLQGRSRSMPSVPLPDLETALSILRTEALAMMDSDPHWWLGFQFVDVNRLDGTMPHTLSVAVTNDPTRAAAMLRKGGGVRQALAVVSSGRRSEVWPVEELDALIAQARRMVTLYSLTGSWNAMQGARGNL